MVYFLSSFLLAMGFSTYAVEINISGKKKYYTEYNKVCTRLGLKHNLFAEPENTHVMNCMGRKVQMNKFCKSQSKTFDRPILRGYINSKLKEAVCETGKAIRLGLNCDGKTKLCGKGSKVACRSLQGLYALELDLTHSSLVNNKLNCYWSMKESNIDLL